MHTISASSDRPKATHCEVFKLIIYILTAVTPFSYVQLILRLRLLGWGLVSVPVVEAPVAGAAVVATVGLPSVLLDEFGYCI